MEKVSDTMWTKVAKSPDEKIAGLEYRVKLLEKRVDETIKAVKTIIREIKQMKGITKSGQGEN
jgi:hypothetical protein